MWLGHFLIHSSAGGHLGGFHLLSTVTSAHGCVRIRESHTALGSFVIQSGAKVGLQLYAQNPEFILVLLLINYYIIFPYEQL